MSHGRANKTAHTGSDAAHLRSQVRLLLSSPGLADQVARGLSRPQEPSAARSFEPVCKPETLAQLARLALNAPLKRSPSPSV